jgi:hypothetical protein
MRLIKCAVTGRLHSEDAFLFGDPEELLICRKGWRKSGEAPAHP